MRDLLTITFILVGCGVIMIYSASAIFAEDNFQDQYYYFKRQLVWAAFGIVAIAISAFLPLELFERFARPFLILNLLTLMLVFTPLGVEVGGAKRWLNLGLCTYQPSEMTKLALLIYCAHFLSRKKELVNDFCRGVFPIILVTALAIILVLLQPDLGTAILVGTLIVALMFIAGVNLKHLALLVAGCLPALALLILTEGYRIRRILVFFNPWSDSRDTGYQIVQSFIAIGSGGLFGKGLGHSVQKLYYLPESFSDFIFSIIGEEIGFVGASAIIILFAGFIFRGVKISKNSPDFFTYLLGIGITTMIGIQAVVHVGVVTGCLPTKGLPLPFVSYGGSSLLTSMTAVGVLINISRRGHSSLRE